MRTVAPTAISSLRLNRRATGLTSDMAFPLELAEFPCEGSYTVRTDRSDGPLIIEPPSRKALGLADDARRRRFEGGMLCLQPRLLRSSGPNRNMPQALA